MKKTPKRPHIPAKKNTGRNYVKKKPETRLCAVCSVQFSTTHPKQRTCLKSECRIKLREMNYEAFIEREQKRILVKRQLKEAERLLVEHGIKEAHRILEQGESSAK